jgi:hypothetical protein
LARLVRHLNANVRWKPSARRAASERADLIAAAQECIASAVRAEEGGVALDHDHQQEDSR